MLDLVIMLPLLSKTAGLYAALDLNLTITLPVGLPSSSSSLLNGKGACLISMLGLSFFKALMPSTTVCFISSMTG